MKIKKLLAQIIISVFAYQIIVYAENNSNRVEILSSRNLNRIESLFDSGVILSSASQQSKRIVLKKPVRVRLRVKGIGRFDTNLTRQKIFRSQSSKIVLLQGRIVKFLGSKKISGVGTASIVKDGNNKYSVRFFSVNKSRTDRANAWKGALNVKAEMKIKNGRAYLSNVSSERSSRKSADKLYCINNQKSNDFGNSDQPADAPAAKKAVKIAKVLIEADNQFAQGISDESQLNEITTYIPSVMNNVDAIYINDLSISLDATLPAVTTNYTSQIAFDENFLILLHEEMKQKKPASSRTEDIHFLFTGKEPTDNQLNGVVGVVPDLGTVCHNPSDSIGFTVHLDQNEDYITTAHEMGHLFNAEHDDAETGPDNPGIMNSGTGNINGEITNFSTYSKNQVSQFVSANSSCLDDGDKTGSGGGSGGGGGSQPGTLPSTAVIDAYKDGKYFAVELYDEDDDSAYDGYEVSVLYKKKSKDTFSIFKTLETDEDGYAEFKPKKAGVYAFQVEDLLSNTLKFKKSKRRN